jgi:hypothetical protein
MHAPLESLRQKVTTFFRKVLVTAAKRSCWWYGIRFDASDPDSLAQLCGITSIELETMFDACGFILAGKSEGKFSQDALLIFVQDVSTCDVSMVKPVSFAKKGLFLKVGTGNTKGAASQYRKGSSLNRPSSATRSLKRCQKSLQESIIEWKELKELKEPNRNPPNRASHPVPPRCPLPNANSRASNPVPPSTPPPHQHISGVLARYNFLVQFIKPEALISTDLWQDDFDKNNFVLAIEKFAASKRERERERKDLTSPICALLGAQKILETIDVTRYPLMAKKGINLRDNLEIQALLQELVLL